MRLWRNLLQDQLWAEIYFTVVKTVPNVLRLFILLDWMYYFYYLLGGDGRGLYFFGIGGRDLVIDLIFGLWDIVWLYQSTKVLKKSKCPRESIRVLIFSVCPSNSAKINTGQKVIEQININENKRILIETRGV